MTGIGMCIVGDEAQKYGTKTAYMHMLNHLCRLFTVFYWYSIILFTHFYRVTESTLWQDSDVNNVLS